MKGKKKKTKDRVIQKFYLNKSVYKQREKTYGRKLKQKDLKKKKMENEGHEIKKNQAKKKCQQNPKTFRVT